MRTDQRAPGGKVTPELGARLKELGLRHEASANLGHSYLLRNTMNRESDDLVLLTLLAVDDAGVSFAWRVLKSFPLR